ncbi:MAG: MFS transporter [Gammaproteobacteria bacterium]
MSRPNQFDLFKQRRYLPFFVTMFFGAFNDNVFKNALAIMFSFTAINVMGMNSDMLINLSAVVFILPYFLFSATAGQLADKYDNAKLMQWVKVVEILVMACAVIGFMFDMPIFLLFVLFLMGTQSAFFGPVKYGFLPRVLKREELVGGNGVTDMGTFLAILLGMILGAHAISYDNGKAVVSVLIVIIAVLGYLASRQIPVMGQSNPALKINLNPITQTWKVIKYSRINYTVFLAVIGISWFWFFGTIFITQIPNFTRNYLFADENVFIMLMGTFSISVGIGSLLCEKLSGGRVEIGLVPLGSIGLTVFAIDFYFAAQHVLPAAEALYTIDTILAHADNWRILFDVFMIGLSSGFYIVPLYALIQERTDRGHISRVIAANNIINSIFMVVAGLMAMVLLGNDIGIPGLFFITAVMNLVIAIYIYRMITEFMWRFIVWISLHTIYRVKTHGLDAIPDKGAAVLVCNHVSFVDALIIAGYVRRPVRFVMDHRIYKTPGLHWIFKLAKAIPIASKHEDPSMLAAAYDKIDEVLNDRELLCIFPEGSITRDGAISDFKKGIEKILDRAPVPVVPMALAGLWGSWFSRYKGRAMKGLPKRIPDVTFSAATPVPAEQVTAEYLQEKVSQLVEQSS